MIRGKKSFTYFYKPFRLQMQVQIDFFLFLLHKKRLHEN